MGFLKKADPIERTRKEIRQLKKLVAMFGGQMDVKGEFIKRLDAEIKKNVKKGKFKYLAFEYKRYKNCPEFMDFWTKDCGLDASTLDEMFPKEALDE